MSIHLKYRHPKANLGYPAQTIGWLSYRPQKLARYLWDSCEVALNSPSPVGFRRYLSIILLLSLPPIFLVKLCAAGGGLFKAYKQHLSDTESEFLSWLFVPCIYFFPSGLFVSHAALCLWNIFRQAVITTGALQPWTTVMPGAQQSFDGNGLTDPRSVRISSWSASTDKPLGACRTWEEQMSVGLKGRE